MFLLDQGLTMTSMTMSRALVWQCSNSKNIHGFVCHVGSFLYCHCDCDVACVCLHAVRWFAADIFRNVAPRPTTEM